MAKDKTEDAADGTQPATPNIEVTPADEESVLTVRDRSKTTLERGSGESGEDQVQDRVDEENAAGYVGRKTDPIPNESYTVAGVTKSDDALVSAESTEEDTSTNDQNSA